MLTGQVGGKAGRPKNFLLDTSVLLHDADSLFAFEDNHVYVLVSVLQDLDKFKSAPGEAGVNARRAATHLDRLRGKGKLCDGVSLDTGGKIHVIPYMKNGLDLNLSLVDNQLLTTALKLSQLTQRKSVVVTKNVNLRVRADGVSIGAEDYSSDRSDSLGYLGYSDVEMECGDIDALYADGELTTKTLGLPLNHYVRLVDATNPNHTGLARIGPDNVLSRVDDHYPVFGIKARNLAQTYAMHALLDESVKIVTLRGKAGTGKTLLAMAAGMYQVMGGACSYSRLTITRPVIPVGRDIGYLPGAVDEKMAPWMRPIYDALDMIRGADATSGRSHIPGGFQDDDIIEVAPLMYVRGRSIANAFMIVDEAQNMTPLEVKTLTTRAGANTKLVFTGDTDQVDNPYLDAHSNGFSYMIAKFMGEPLHAHVELVKGERSPLAELAATKL